MSKKVKLIVGIVLSLVLSFALVGIVGCSDEGDSAEVADAPEELPTLTVGATPAPHAEILEFLRQAMRDEGIELSIVEYTDYVLPNTALDAGELDVNFFQHLPYLESFNEENGTDLSPVVGVHFEPLGLYPGQTDSLEDISQGAKIAIPSDPTNGARALNLLQAADLITLEADAGLFATPRDIVENKYDLDVVEVEAAQLSRVLPDLDFAVINGNYALESGLDFDSALAVEGKDSEAAARYTNYLVARTDRVDDEAIQKLGALLNSEVIRTFIEERYEGRVVPTF